MFKWEAYVVSLMMRKGLEAAADAGRGDVEGIDAPLFLSFFTTNQAMIYVDGFSLLAYRRQ